MVPLEPYPIYSGIIPKIIISINYVDIGTYYRTYHIVHIPVRYSFLFACVNKIKYKC